jgi:hypothetical protein
MVRRIREEIIDDGYDTVREPPVVVERRVRTLGFGPNPAAIALALVIAVVLIVLIASAL